MGTCKGNGTGDNKFISYFVRYFLVSGTGRNTLFWDSFAIFWWDFADRSIFFTPNGTGHNDGLEIVRYKFLASQQHVDNAAICRRSQKSWRYS